MGAKTGTSILELDRLICLHGIARERCAVEIFSVHVHGVNLAAAVGRVVIDAGFCVAAARVQRDLVFSVLQLAAAARLLDGGQDVEKLADRGFLRVI